MSLNIVRNDITKMKVDAIVNAANSSLLGGGGVDGAIHKAAGPGLLEECRTIGGCPAGEARITKGYDLPAKYVIHTVGPVWNGGNSGEEELLRKAYRSSLELAVENGIESIAFPIISGGAYGYPKREAIDIAMSEFRTFLEDHDIAITLVLYDRDSYLTGLDLRSRIQAFIDDNYVDEHFIARSSAERFSGMYRSAPPTGHMPAATSGPAPKYSRKKRENLFGRILPKRSEEADEELKEERYIDRSNEPLKSITVDGMYSLSDLESRLREVDESFSQMLIRKIDEKGITDSECYKRANIDRKHFSKIKNDPAYKPRKQTALAFAVALELPLAETEELLRKAGFALSHSSKSDIIVEYFIRQHTYDIFTINEVLFEFDQPLLGT